MITPELVDEWINNTSPSGVMSVTIPTWFIVFGIIAGDYISLSLPISALLSIFTFLGLALAFKNSFKTIAPKPYFSLALVFSSFSLGLLLQSLHYQPNQKLHYSNYVKHEPQTIGGYISERLKPNDYNERFYFSVRSIDNVAAKGRLLVTVDKKTAHKLHPGNRLLITERLSPISKPLNPSEFDYGAYMEKQGVFHQLKIKDNYSITGKARNFDYYLGSLRDKLQNSFSIHGYTPQVQSTLNTLLLGQRQDMDKAIDESYKNAGVMHILAISGLHFSVLFYLLGLLLKPITRFGWQGKVSRLIILLSIMWGFALITGLSASVVRSVVMFTVICSAQYLNRDTNIYNSLFISMLVLLVANPYFIFDAGFQLSYLAVFSIVLLEPVYKKLTVTKYRAVNYINDTIAVSLAAQLGVLPLSLYYFNRFPLLFLVANLVVIPLSNLVLILGIVVLILNFIWTDAALIAGKLLGSLVELMNNFINYIASYESLVIKEIPFTFLLTILLYLVITAVIIWLYNTTFRRTIAVLASILVFQCVFIISTLQKQSEELIVFNNYKESLITVKEKKTLTVYCDDSLSSNRTNVRSYSRSHFNPELHILPFQNILYHQGKKILIIDNNITTESIKLNPDILVLSGSPKLNLDRIITELKPKQIVADATNYKSSIKHWKQTCLKLKIPFHATAEKGYYKLY